METELLILRNQIAIMQALRVILADMGRDSGEAYCALLVARENTMSEVITL